MTNLIPLPKICCTCHIKKLSVEFSKNKNRPDGLEPRCKTCTNVCHKRRMLENPDYKNEKYRANQNEFHSTMEVSQIVIDRLHKRLETEHKECKVCKVTKPLTEFYVRIRYGKHINIRPLCKNCHNRKTVLGMKYRPTNEALGRYKQNANKRGYGFDLDLDFVKNEFSKPCTYCGETEILLTLDRKNSSLGYLKDNCVACCIRCNLVKADMPYEAWLLIADAMRNARVLGLFGSWSGRRNFNVKAVTK